MKIHRRDAKRAEEETRATKLHERARNGQEGAFFFAFFRVFSWQQCLPMNAARPQISLREILFRESLLQRYAKRTVGPMKLKWRRRERLQQSTWSGRQWLCEHRKIPYEPPKTACGFLKIAFVSLKTVSVSQKTDDHVLRISFEVPREKAPVPGTVCFQNAGRTTSMTFSLNSPSSLESVSARPSAPWSPSFSRKAREIVIIAMNDVSSGIPDVSMEKSTGISCRRRQKTAIGGL